MAPRELLDVDRGRARRPPERPRREQCPSRPDHPGRSRTLDRRAERAQAEPAIGDHGHPAGPPHPVHRSDEVDAGRRDHGHAIARFEASPHQIGRDRIDPPGEFGEAHLVAGRHVDERRRVVSGPGPHTRPQPPKILVCVGISEARASEIPTQTWVGVGGGDDLRHEVVGDGGDVGFGHHEVVGVGEAVQHGVRQSRPEISGEVVVEHRVARTPRQQHRDGDLTQPIGDRGDRPFGRMTRFERNVPDEVGDRHAGLRRLVRRPKRGTIGRRQPIARQADRALDEHRCPVADEFEHARRGGQPDDGRSGSPLRNGDPGVAQNHPGESIDVVDGPTHGDRTTPVVGGEEQRHVGADVERAHHVVEVRHASGEAALRRALAVAHPELIDGDHAVRRTEPSQE